MTQARIEFVGGPADGKTIERPKASRVAVPVVIPGQPGVGQCFYTLRRCRDDDGNIVEALAPAGRDVDRKWLAARGLKN